jgi:hypothetical protein
VRDHVARRALPARLMVPLVRVTGETYGARKRRGHTGGVAVAAGAGAGQMRLQPVRGRFRLVALSTLGGGAVVIDVTGCTLPVHL